MSRLRRAILGLLVAMTVLAVIEAGLRAIGVAALEPFFLPVIDHDGRHWMVTNDHVGDNWFRSAEWEDLLREPRHEWFLTDKPADTYRIFVLGESSAYGTHLDDSATWASQLEHLLAVAQDTRRVEVINMGLRAVSASVYQDVLSELLAQDPDLVVLYAGHNEFYGVRQARFPRNLRLWRLLEGLQGPVVSHDQSAALGIRPDALHPGGGSVERAVAARFAETLDHLVEDLAGVPLLVFQAHANERHVAPLCSDDGGDEQAGERAARLLAWVASTPEILTPADCEPETLAALPGHAGSSWVAGWCAQASGDLQASHAAFRSAIDSDCAPIRARSSVMEAIRTLPDRHPDALVAVVEPLEALTRACRGSALGHEVFYDHVHPNLLGSYLLARSAADVLARDPARFGLDLDPAALPSYDEALEGLGLGPLDAWTGLARVRWFYERSFVAGTASRDWSLGLFEADQAPLWARLDETGKAMLQQNPRAGAAEVRQRQAQLHGALGSHTLALRYSRAAVASQPGCGRCRVDLAHRLAAVGRPAAAREQALIALMFGADFGSLAELLR